MSAAFWAGAFLFPDALRLAVVCAGATFFAAGFLAAFYARVSFSRPVRQSTFNSHFHSDGFRLGFFGNCRIDFSPFHVRPIPPIHDVNRPAANGMWSPSSCKDFAAVRQRPLCLLIPRSCMKHPTVSQPNGVPGNPFGCTILRLSAQPFFS